MGRGVLVHSCSDVSVGNLKDDERRDLHGLSEYIRPCDIDCDGPPDSSFRLPSDIIILILSFLPVVSLRNLSLSCKHLHDLVSNFGWVSHLRSNNRASWSLSCVDSIWSPYQRVRYNTIAERNWRNQNFVARPLSAPWRGKLHPKLAVSRGRLVVAAGRNLIVYAFRQPWNSSDSPMVQLEASYFIDAGDYGNQVHHDITAVAFLQDGGEDRNLLVGFGDGYVLRVTLPDAKKDDSLLKPDIDVLDIGEDPIRSISSAGNFSFTLSSLGKAILRDREGKIVSERDLNARSWSSFISPAGAPYVAVGTSSTLPLAVYPIHDAILSAIPSAALTSVRASEWASRSPASAVYGITGPPPSFPGNPSQILVSGWFDGRVRLYDLRIPPSSSMSFASSTRAVPALSPTMTLSDPWATESIYCVSSGGGSGHTIAAGTARHSVVAFWDVRAVRESWSVHAPGNDPSPVYDIALESSRLFGATQSRGFVLDFGPDVGVDTFPRLPHVTTTGRRNRRGLDDSLWTDDGVHYEVTKYLHRNPMAGG